MSTETRIAITLTFTLTLVGPSAGARSTASDDIPTNLTAEVRLIEARSLTPDFRAMHELSFFIDTDGVGVSEEQWLATIARSVPESFLATLASETVSTTGGTAELRVDTRSRSLRLSLDLAGFEADETFQSTVTGELMRRGETERSFEKTLRLRAGQTHVWSDRELELAPSEYLSHFRDYRDREHRAALYEELRNFATFLVVAVSVRRSPDAERASEPVTLELPEDVEIPELRSPLSVDLVGTVTLELQLDASGAPTGVKILRSSIPELNSQILGEAVTWRFPEAAGRRGRLTLELEAAGDR